VFFYHFENLQSQIDVDAIMGIMESKIAKESSWYWQSYPAKHKKKVFQHLFKDFPYFNRLNRNFYIGLGNPLVW
jgi:hypothetical protein